MPRTAPESLLEQQRRFTERLAEQLHAARSGKPLDAEALLAERQAYLKQRVAALQAMEAARQSALARFDADIAHRRKQIAQLEAGLKLDAEARKMAVKGEDKSPARTEPKPVAPVKGEKAIRAVKAVKPRPKG